MNRFHDMTLRQRMRVISMGVIGIYICANEREYLKTIGFTEPIKW